MKIAIAGLHIEASSYNPGRSRDVDFRVLRGDDLLAAPAFAFLSEFDAELVPVFYARAVPGAPIDPATYAGFRDEILSGLADAAPLDGVYLCLHGAASIAGMEDAEADLLTAIRETVGPDCLISVSYDLHGNLSQGVVDAIDMFTAYRTAPHVDVIETQRRAVEHLLRAIATGVRPSLCWCPIPVVLPGEKTSTEDQPAGTLYARIEDHLKAPGLWDASQLVGYVWTDEPRVSAASVVTGVDAAAMETAAAQMARDYWNARADFRFGTVTGTISETLEMARSATDLPVVLADSGDNPTAGGAGDRVDMLEALLASGLDRVILAGIADRPATEAAFAAGLRASLDLSIGGTIDGVTGRSISVTAQVVHLQDDPDPAERQAVLRAKGIDFVVTARRRPFHRIEDFSCLGLEPREARVIVVKSGYLSPEMNALAETSIMALSPGIVDQHVERLPRHRTRRPTFPFDRDFSYTPEVAWSARSRRPS